jgi:hypothetical protein
VKAPSRDEPRKQTAALIKAFLACATSAFGPLVSSPTAKWSVRVEHATSKGIVEVDPENVSGFFFVTASFANPFVQGNITFGDRELMINTAIGPAKGSSRYGLWEWADAVDRPALVPHETAFVTTFNRMEEIVASMAAAVRALEDVIASPAPTVIERIEAARVRVQRGFQARFREDEHRRAAAQAAEAFRAHDFRRVVSILEEVEGLLTPAERDKLAYARRSSNPDSH